ncbi:hypothetical protein [Longimicrobium sp.]|uniref:hypothetical protein n=1 Tax=Longimicrobium sp. TaxID=2029185 RepID=UPI002E2FBFFF|nr:hypothetical protein [Longimicrobium sp.]
MASPEDAVGWTVLPALQGQRVLRSCSPTPEDGEGPWSPAGFWEPDSATVRNVEARLPAVLDSVLPLVVLPAGERTLGLRGDRYYRQYVGITRGGTRLVYVHGVHAAFVHPSREAVHGISWKTHLLAWCDAGAGLFGVVYDPRTETFGRLELSDSYFGAVRY